MNKWLLAIALFSSPIFASPVNINRADARIIAASLTGVGIKKADAIVADRLQNGDFKSIDDLKRVVGIGEKTIAVNRTDILLVDSQTVTVNINIPVVIKTSVPPPEKTFKQESWITRIFWLFGVLSMIALSMVIVRKYFSSKKPKIKEL